MTKYINEYKCYCMQPLFCSIAHYGGGGGVLYTALLFIPIQQVIMRFNKLGIKCLSQTSELYVIHNDDSLIVTARQ